MVLHCLADIAREEVTRMKRPSKIRLPNPLNSLSLVVVVVVYPIGKNFSKLCQKGSKLTNYHFGQSLLWPFSLFYRVVRPSVRPSIRALPRPPRLCVWPPTAAAAAVSSCPNNYLIPLNEHSKWPHLPKYLYYFFYSSSSRLFKSMRDRSYSAWEDWGKGVLRAQEFFSSSLASTLTEKLTFERSALMCHPKK